MGRELKRKQAKRDGKNVKEAQNKNKEKPMSPKTFIVILIMLAIFFVALYILTGLFITKEIKWFSKNEEDTPLEIENKILASETLNQMEEVYYVFYYDTTEEEDDLTNDLYALIEKVYRVDLNDDFNSNYIGEPSGVVKKLKDLKVSSPTLVKVESGKIKEFYSGADKIRKALD